MHTMTQPGTDNFLGVNASALNPSYSALYIYDPATPTYYKIINNGSDEFDFGF
jgi:hypothetical protein